MENKQVFSFEGLTPLSTRVPRVSGRFSMCDRLGALKVRLAFSRQSYSVNPGLYAIGHPDSHSDVFVTSNYKLTFDLVRRNLRNMNAWILVLDTKGVNVWCAAGKGTFGTAELIRRIQATSLRDIVSHKKLILPQLGAVGVAAHQIKEKTGFSVVYGPVRVSDVPAFVAKGYKVTSEMRRVEFPWFERFKIAPVDVVLNFKYLLIALVVLAGLSGFHQGAYSLEAIIQRLPALLIAALSGYFAGTLFTPLFLSALPFRSFSAKGGMMGILVAMLLLVTNLLGDNMLENVSWFLMIGAVSSFLGMNFTGASTYTSLSGVLKEMKIAIPLQIGCATVGLILFVASGIMI
jgi:hypothetical protein